jgi:hypothetical protein
MHGVSLPFLPLPYGFLLILFETSLEFVLKLQDKTKTISRQDQDKTKRNVENKLQNVVMVEFNSWFIADGS